MSHHYAKFFRRPGVRRAFLVVLLVFIPQLFFQLHVVEGPSMWPTFNDGVSREWVVSLRSWIDRDPEIYDIMVIEDPERPGEHVVKRVVALPGDLPNVVDGDLRVRSLGLDQEWFLKRNLDQILMTSVPFMNIEHMRSRLSGSGWETTEGLPLALVPLEGACSVADEGGFLKLEPGKEQCQVRIPEGNIVDNHKTATGALARGKNIVRDLLISFGLYDALQIPEGTRFLLEHFCGSEEKPAASLALTTTATGLNIVLSEGGKPSFEKTIGRLDHASFRLVWVDDVQALLMRPRPSDDFELLFQGSRQPILKPGKSYLKLLCEGGSVILSHLDIDRDIHYTLSIDQMEAQDLVGPSNEAQVAPDKYYLLGDNSPQSRDSRQWPTTAPFQIEGRPILVVWPWSRIRKLP